MFGIQTTTRFTSTTPSTDELTLAQRNAVEQLPFPLRELISRDVVSARWALALPSARLKVLDSQHICDLLSDDVLKPADIASRLDTFFLSMLEDHASVRSLLRDAIITTEQISALNVRQLFKLVTPEFQQTLRAVDNQLKVKAGELTIGELMQRHRTGGSVISSASSSAGGMTSTTALSSSTTLQPRKVSPSEWHLPSSMDTNGKVVTVGWPKTAAQHFLLLETVKPIWNLVNAGLLSRAEARNLDQSEIATLEECPAICALVADKVISSEQLVSLRFDQLTELTRPEIRQKLRDREWTIADGRLVATNRYIARGALNYASSGYLGKSDKAQKAGTGAIQRRDGGATAFCLNLHVLDAIRDILRRGEDIETIAIIFDNALRYDYLDELAEVVNSSNENLLSWTTNFDNIETLTSKLEERGLQLKVKSNGEFELSELAMGPVNQDALEAGYEVLDAFLPRSVSSSIIARYEQGLSFEMSLSRRYVKEISRFRQFPAALAYLKQAFNEGVIDSVYINEHIDYYSLNGIHQILLAQHRSPTLKDLVNNHKGIMLWFSSMMLRHLINEPSPCRLIERGELAWKDLLEIDAIFEIRKVQGSVQDIFRTVFETRAWLRKNRLRSQHEEVRLSESGHAGVEYFFLQQSLADLAAMLQLEEEQQVALTNKPGLLSTSSPDSSGSTRSTDRNEESLYAIFSAEEQTRFALNDEQLDQLNAKLPVQRLVLRALLTAELCTPAFAVKCPLFFCMTLSKPHFLNLILNQVISLEDATRKFSEHHFRCLELYPSVCQLLADGIITGAAFIELNRSQLNKLHLPAVQQKLRMRDVLETGTSSVGSVIDQL